MYPTSITVTSTDPLDEANPERLREGVAHSEAPALSPSSPFPRGPSHPILAAAAERALPCLRLQLAPADLTSGATCDWCAAHCELRSRQPHRVRSRLRMLVFAIAPTAQQGVARCAPST